MSNKNVEWYCDNCRCHMNLQDGFNTDSGIWICKECGFENDVTDDSISKGRVHVFLCTKIGWAKEQEYVWFDTTLYTRSSAEDQFIENIGYTQKNNGETYPYTYYEYDGIKYHDIHYVGEFDCDDMP